MYYDTVIIDGNHLLHRILSIESHLQMEHNGVKVGGIFGFLRSLRSVLHRFPPNRCFVTWDHGLSERRLKIFPGYKKRDRSDEYLNDFLPMFINQAERIESILPSMGVHTLKLSGREGDDLVAWISDFVNPQTVLIVSSDADFHQLISNRVHQYRFQDEQPIDLELLKQQTGYTPEQFLLYRAVVGDSSDRIPGVNGVGDITVKDLIRNTSISDVEDLASACLNANSFRATLIAENIDVVHRNMDLMDLREEQFIDGEIALLLNNINCNLYCEPEMVMRFMFGYGMLNLLHGIEEWILPFKSLV